MSRALTRLGRFGVVVGVGLLVADLWPAWYLTPGLRHGSPVAIVLAAGLVGIVVVTAGWAFFPAQAGRVVAWTLRQRRRLGGLRWPMLVGMVVAFPWLALYVPATAEKLAPASARWLEYGVVAVLAAWLLASDEAERVSFTDFLRGVLLSGALFAFLSAYTQVTGYPFSLYWSEGNRLWDYSLMFARRRYLYPTDQPIFAHIDPGRQFLWGLVYLIPGVGIFGVRLWSAFLFTVPYLLFAWSLFARPSYGRQLTFWLGLWGFLFLNQGPIYTPLLLSAWLVLLAVRDAPWGLGLLLALGAGYYATLTRYTWFLAPPLWALLLALGLAKNQSLPPRRRWLMGASYSLSALVGAGLTGNLNKFFLTAWSLLTRGLGLNAGTTAGEAFAARQPLLWSRLWPNPTYPQGIVFGLLLAVGPMLLLWVLWYRRKLWSFPRSVALVVSGSLLYFLVVGVIASLKIGGGNNLHNLDMLFIGLLFVAWLLWQQPGVAEWWQSARWSGLERAVLLAAVVIPMFAPLNTPPREFPPREQWEPVLQRLQQEVRRAQAQGGEILFMDQRQLLTFGFVPAVPLVPEYEKKYMMDKAMAGDAAYFARYYHDLAQGRFALIVSDPFHIYYEGGKNFSEENNAWMKWVVEPTLCFYRPLVYFKRPSVGLLVPRDEPQLGCLTRLPVLPAP